MLKAFLKLLKPNKGVSLAELLVAISLLGILLSLGFVLLTHSINTFVRGEQGSIIQKDIRHAADVITRELRYATSMDFITSYPTGGDGVYSYIFFDASNKKIILYTKSGSVKYITEKTINALTFTTEYKPIYGEGQSKILLHFSITGKMNLEEFNIQSSVLLMNMTTNKTPQSNTVGIKYIRP